MGLLFENMPTGCTVTESKMFTDNFVIWKVIQDEGDQFYFISGVDTIKVCT